MDTASIQDGAVTDVKLASPPSTTATAGSLVKRDLVGGAAVSTLTAVEAAVDSVSFPSTALIKRGANDAMLVTGSGLYLGAAGSRTAGGSGNVGLGPGALGALTTGSDNIAIGSSAGFSVTSGNDNIYLANAGVVSESGVIRIGNATDHAAAFVAGVNSSTLVSSPVQVYVDTEGRLGTIASTAASKYDVADAGGDLDRLALLRPVRFRYRGDPAGEAQYGLIAEEVEAVFPELVRWGDDGRPASVRYHLLAPLVLAQGQRNREALTTLEARVAERADLEAKVAGLEARVAEAAALESRLADAERRLRAAEHRIRTLEEAAAAIGMADGMESP